MTSTGLKCLALALMLFDHIGEFIPGAPLWLRWIGRLSAPLFFYCAAVAFRHTSNRRKYLLRLYVSGVVMAILNFVLNNYYASHDGVAAAYITNNIFVTIFLFCVVVWIVETLQTDPKHGWLAFGAFAAFQLLTTVLSMQSETLLSNTIGAPRFIGAVLPNLIYNEGGVLWIFLGVALYFCQRPKSRLAAVYGGYCAVLFALTLISAISLSGGISIADGGLFSVGQYLTRYDFQWMMIGALPFMLLDNGQKGPGLKWLFYIFYPAHIIALFLIGNIFF